MIKNGKYKCQFCLKLFEERHRINGHLGNHIKDYLKKLDASGGMTNEPASVQIPFGALMIQTSIGINSDSDEITSNTKTNSEIISTIPYCEMKAYTTVEAYCGKQDRVPDISNDEVGKMNEVTDIVAAEISVCSEPAFLSNENNVIHRSSD